MADRLKRLADATLGDIIDILGGGLSGATGSGLSGIRSGMTPDDIKERFRKSILEQNSNDDPWTSYRRANIKLKDLVNDAKNLERQYLDVPEGDLAAKFAAFERFNQKRAEMQWAFERKANSLNNLDRNLQSVGNSIKQFGTVINQLTDAWGKADQAAANYAKSVAMSAKGMAELRDNTIGNVNQAKIGIRFDTSADELLKMQQNYADSIGRNVGASDENQINMAAMNKVMGDRGADMMLKLENFGLSINDAAERSGKMFATASKYGLDFTKYSKNFLDNITIAQNYTFKNGLRGLESMAKKATAIKLDMKQVAQFAEKVQTVEGAMDVASKLQVLGGAFSGLADPLGMLNEGLNDMEGLTDRLTGMIKGMGTFNQKTGEIEVSTFNKQRIKAAASAMGMSYDSLMQTVNAGARREEVDRQLRTSGQAGLSDEMKELIRNTATIQNGEAGVSINGKFTKVSDLTNDDYNDLIARTKSDSDNIQDIATTLRGMKDIQSGFKKQLDNQTAGIFGWLGGIAKSAIALVGSVGAILGAVAIGKGLFGGFHAVAGANKSIFGMVKQRMFSGAGLDMLGKVPYTPPAPIGSVTSTASTGGPLASGGASTITRLPRKMDIGRKTTSGLLKVMGKSSTGRAIASTVGKNILKGGGIGIAAGIAGAGLSALRDNRVKNGNGKKGDSTDNLMTVGSSALKWAGIGASTIGLVAGPAIGAAIGAVGGTIIGLAQKGKRKAEANLETALSTKGLTAQGKYNRKEMKGITKAIATGKLDDDTKTKLIAQGDSAIVDEIDKRRIKEAKIASIGAVPMRSNGNDAVKLSPTARREEENKAKDINLNIDGKLKLEGANGKEVDVTKELMAALKNPSFIKNTLIPIIMKGLNESKYGTNVPSGINRYAIV